MTSYLENFSNMKSLLDSISGHRNKLATAGNPIDIKRITKKIETEEDLLLNAVVSLSPSPGIDEILAEIMYGDLFGFIEDIRDYRSQLERFLGQGNRVDADRITRELAPLESALSRICGLEVERGKIESVLGPPDCVKVAHSSETVDGKKSLALRQPIMPPTPTLVPSSGSLLASPPITPAPPEERQVWANIRRTIPSEPENLKFNAEKKGPEVRRQSWSPRPGIVINVVHGDVVRQGTEGVVNAANERLEHGTGIAGSIRKAGGALLVAESNRWVQDYGSVPVGGVAVTGAGDIAGATKVIHAVGPCVKKRGHATESEREQLARAILNICAAASKHNLRTVAVPAISTGVFGFPVPLAATILVNGAVRFALDYSDARLEEVRFVAWSETDFEAFESALTLVSNEEVGGGSNSKADLNPRLLPSSHQHAGNNDAIIVGGAPENVLGQFKAAGILLYKIVAGEVKILVGREFRAEGRVLNFLGGRRNFPSFVGTGKGNRGVGAAGRSESPEDTAVREFCEESGGVVKASLMRQCLSAPSTVQIWYGPGKYVLFVAKCPNEHVNMDKAFNTLPVAKRGLHAEMDSLLWLRWEGVSRILAANASQKGGGGSQAVLYETRVWREVVAHELSDLLKKVLRNNDVASVLNGLLRGDHLVEVLRAIQTEIASASHKQPDPATSEDWRLRLKMPEIKEFKPPISEVPKGSALYETILNMLPETHRSRVYSIRNVEVQNRIAEHAAEELKLKGDPKNNVQIIPSTIHGTPERWRATNIAFKGFDLSIILNGRASGNGVYSATDVSIPLGYCGSAGTLIVMRGILTANDANNNPIYVFRGAKQVLPTTLIDFAASNEAAATNEAEVHHAEVEALRRRNAEMAEVAEKEKQYLAEAQKRQQLCLSSYVKRLQGIAAELDALGSVERQKGRGDAAGICRQFEIERQQYNAHPRPAIYADKEKLIQVLCRDDVVVIFAGTGSGKSTQVPQYVLDDVLDPSDRRRVAVLEPRRFNAISLCQRVSKERGQSVGTEVGYSLGQGDICITPQTTRIEFMTHGLFINRAMDAEKLLDQYAAVILDEAHERSMEVDLCFALLRKALEQAAPTSSEASGKRKMFKIIVASATVSEKNLEMFKAFLAGGASGCKSSIFRVSGNSFPVLVQHRPEAEPDWKDVNSQDAARSLASYALEIAINLIQQSAHEQEGRNGNILIFMPGESIITKCMDGLKSWSLFSEADTDTTGSKSATKEAAGGTSLRTTEDYSFELPVGRYLKGRKKITVGVYPFHAKITEATRQKMIDHKDAGQQIIIIFSTNAAETGLTLPNIRHVIDPGLERRVVWNSATGLKEMRTVQITKSSMKQRTGRAGRERSGICVRLYAPETEATFEEEPPPAIESADVLRTVLLIHTRRFEGVHRDLEMLTKIPGTSQASAELLLRQIGALDTSNNPTALGANLMKLGLPLQLGKFLLACHERQCLGAAADIVAMLAVTNALSLLPTKTMNPEFYAARSFLDPWGDHFTLLNIFRAFQGCTNRDSFCARYDLDLGVLEEVERARSHLEGVCLSMQLAATDSATLAASSDAWRRAIRQSLCSAFFDQILSVCNPGSPGGKFVRVLPEKDAVVFQNATQQFATEVGLNKTVDPTNPNSLTTTGAPLTPSPVTADDGESAAPPPVALQHRSGLWFAPDTASSEVVNGSLAVYHSLMLTDSTRGGIVQCVSFVTKADIEAGACSWCSSVGFDALVSSLRSRTEEFSLGPSAIKCLLANGGQLMRKYVNRFSAVRGNVDRERGVLRISAPQYWLDSFRGHSLPMLLRIDHEGKGKHDEEGEFSLDISSLDRGQVGQVINRFGKGGKEKKEKMTFVNQLNSMLDQAGISDDDAFRPIVPEDLRVDSNSTPNRVVVTLFGPSRQFASILMGAVKSEVASLFSAHQGSLLRLNAAVIASGATSGKHQVVGVMPNLAALSSSVTPAYTHDRASAMLYIAHAVIWRCPCKVYGGFVRDFVVRNDPANDIDVAFEPTKVSLNTIKGVVTTAAKEIGLRVVEEKQKGQAYTMVLREGSGSFDVDLVDQANSRRLSTAPGVDCDVGNLVVEAPSSSGKLGLSLKVPNNQLVSLSESQRNCRNKSFVFYYHESNSTSSRRLEKYLDRGWKCLNELDGALLSLVQSSKGAGLYDPQPQYKKPYHTFQPPGTH